MSFVLELLEGYIFFSIQTLWMIYYQVFRFKLIKLEDLISAYTDCV